MNILELNEKQRKIVSLEALIESNRKFITQMKKELQNLPEYNEAERHMAIFSI